jgi:hypothetical protein
LTESFFRNAEGIYRSPGASGYGTRPQSEGVKQEGIVFRHFLRLILLLEEFGQVCPADITPEAWQAEVRQLSDQLTASCREVDPTSTDEVIQLAHAADVVEGEAAVPGPAPSGETPAASTFGFGVDLPS